MRRRQRARRGHHRARLERRRRHRHRGADPRADAPQRRGGVPVALPAARDVDAHGDRRPGPSTAKERPRSDAPRAIRDGATRTKGRVRGAQATRVAHDDADVRRIRRSDVRGGHVCIRCVGFVNNRRRLRYLRARGRVRVARGDRASDATPGPTPDPGRATDDTSATREAREEQGGGGDSSVGVERPRRFIRHG